MARYAVHFEFDEAIEAPVEPRHALEGETLEDAKLQAALLYALADFESLPAYRILRDGWAEVYRYPESEPDHRGASRDLRASSESGRKG
jgi:hypothetical protein